MSRTKRCWSCLPISKWDCEPWKRTVRSTFGYHRTRRIRKEIRKSIRSVNRTMFAKGYFEPIIEVGGEWFD